ncbi:MAG: valine--tRNA ligase [bacterium]|nr:valine--tRNA ligase [bacterium]
MAELEKNFDAKEAEPRIYKTWESSGYFNPDNLPVNGQSLKVKSFSIIMPPPNANGSLHIGHALFVTTQDIMIRYKRMAGFKTLWLPGADHAGFETQVVYAKKIEKEGRKFWEIPREQLYNEIKEFTLANKAHMESQLRALGASCDWSREKFTLDEDIKGVVYDTFKKLYDDGLVYRGARIINWCARHQTSLSDLEVSQPEVEDTFYYLKYGPFTIATARPETKFGDKYVVVHPDDKRYSQYKDGQQFELEWINGKITATLIKDSAIDMSFGTGAMTITPWHDSADFEIAQRHNLPKEQIIDWQGKLLPIAGEFASQHISKARPLIVEKLKVKSLLVKSESYKHAVPQCFKCNTPIEPQIRPQWFVAMTKKPRPKGARLAQKIWAAMFPRKSLRDLAVSAVKKGEVTFVTERFKNDFLRWMENLRDWNISRQIVWGIQIPVWYRDRSKNKELGIKEEEVYVGEKSPGEGWTQDPDVFDTWFSSGQWPFATLMTSGHQSSSSKTLNVQRKTLNDFDQFYPTDVMETGWDILFFWVARMVMLGKYRTGKAPFKTVYLHGLVRDKERQKMSKSKGNVIDPLGIAEQYGMDAVRMALIAGNAPATDPVISEDKIKGYRNFTTKIWNMAKFVLEYAEPFDSAQGKQTEMDSAVLKELEAVKKEVTGYLDDYKLHLAAESIYHYVWHTVADKIIEANKAKKVSYAVLHRVFSESLKMLHPFMPFVTEEIWGKLGNKNLLMIEKW